MKNKEIRCIKEMTCKIKIESKINFPPIINSLKIHILMKSFATLIDLTKNKSIFLIQKLHRKFFRKNIIKH